MLKLPRNSAHKRSKSLPQDAVVDDAICTHAKLVGFSSSLTEIVLSALNTVATMVLFLREQDAGGGKGRFMSRKQEVSVSPANENSLKQEINQLETRLQDQFRVRGALENALGHKSVAEVGLTEKEVPKPATELIKEIAVLEVEVLHLEQHLLSLYRKAFNQQALGERSKSQKAVQSTTVTKDEDDLDSAVYRCHSALSLRSTMKASTAEDALARALHSCHSQPLYMAEYAQNAPNAVSLAEHLGTRISDYAPETPNRISEDMVRCICAIYCKLADPPSCNTGLSSPISSLSSSPCEIWSPTLKTNPSFEVRLDNPFLVEGLKDFSGPYSTMLEVQCLHRDNQKLREVEILLRNFRSLVSRLEDVDPRKLKRNEKLAFWINIHNALVMHAYLAHGIPQNTIKRLFLLSKAAYNVGGRTINADTIQNSILCCRMARPGQWLRVLIPSKSKFKSGDDGQSYSVHHREPLLHFALSSGSHSDPAVRLYTSNRVMEEMETAKEEYLRASLGIRKDKKILLPKVVELYAKEAGLSQNDVVEVMKRISPDGVRKAVEVRQRKIIEWIPCNFAFRYLISRDILR